MQQIINNLIRSRAPMMVGLRTILLATVALLGVIRMRYLVFWFSYPDTYIDRDIVQAYLMAKALVSGVNPYLPLNDLVHMFIGNFNYLPHPAPYPPFVALFSVPLSVLTINKMIIAWFIFELVCLATLAALLTILWKGRVDWIRTIVLFFILLAWFPVMIELSWGQFTILMTVLLLATLLAMKKDHMLLAGVFLGLSLALKMITWPVLIYLILKKNWRAVIASSLTAGGLNLVTLAVIGIRPFMDYYLHGSTQVLDAWQGYIYNFSYWSIGYRLFAGTESPILIDPLKVPPLINLPWAAQLVSFAVSGLFLFLGLRWAMGSKQLETSFAIMVCVIIAVSPLSWHHSFVMLIISLTVMLQTLAKQSFPYKTTLVYLGIVLLLFLFNEQIAHFTISLNGGKDILLASGKDISFISSLLFWIPMLEVGVLTTLLWRSAVRQKQPALASANLLPIDAPKSKPLR